MSADIQLQYDGLAEMLDELRRLPDEFKDEGISIVRVSGELAEAEILRGYPTRTSNLRHRKLKAPGSLRAGLSLRVTADSFGASVLLKSNAKHAWLYEHGSQARHSSTHEDLGAMPPHPVFGTAMDRARRRVRTRLKALLQRAALQVSGD